MPDDTAVLNQRVGRLERDMERNDRRLDAVVRLEERVGTVQSDVRDLTKGLADIVAQGEARRNNELEQLKVRRLAEAADKKQDRRTLWAIAGSLFVGIVLFILGLAQAGILGGH